MQTEQVRRVGVKTAADLIDISEWTIRKAITNGELPASRVGRRNLIRLTDLDKWASRNDWHDL